MTFTDWTRLFFLHSLLLRIGPMEWANIRLQCTRIVRLKWFKITLQSTRINPYSSTWRIKSCSPSFRAMIRLRFINTIHCTVFLNQFQSFLFLLSFPFGIDQNQRLFSFLSLSIQAVHVPVEAPSSYTDPYSDLIQDKTRRTFAGMLSAADESIGNITAVLEQNGYLEKDGNTVLIVSSDNGGQSNPSVGGAQNGGSSNYPLRGGKGTIYEGGERLTAALWATEDLVPKKVFHAINAWMKPIESIWTILIVANIS